MNDNNPFGNQHQPQPKKKTHYKAPTNFIEALKDAGSSIASDTAKGISRDLIGGTVKQTADTIFGGNAPQQDQQPQSQDNFNFENYMRSAEAEQQRQKRHMEVKQEYERSEVEIFNQRKRETDMAIKEIQNELQRLAAEMKNLDQSTQAVIQQEVIDPGLYHQNFFETILSILRLLRKKVSESSTWANMHASKKNKSYYWQQSNAKKGGTKFMLSSERSVVTQTG